MRDGGQKAPKDTPASLPSDERDFEAEATVKLWIAMKSKRNRGLYGNSEETPANIGNVSERLRSLSKW